MPEKNDLQILAVSRSAVPEKHQNVTVGDSVIPAGFLSPTDDFHEKFDLVCRMTD